MTDTPNWGCYAGRPSRVFQMEGLRERRDLLAYPRDWE
jgi:hypothetical protein